MPRTDLSPVNSSPAQHLKPQEHSMKIIPNNCLQILLGSPGLPLPTSWYVYHFKKFIKLAKWLQQWGWIWAHQRSGSLEQLNKIVKIAKINKYNFFPMVTPDFSQSPYCPVLPNTCKQAYLIILFNITYPLLWAVKSLCVCVCARTHACFQLD